MSCLQEEIAHCAAGVRWLTYLHRQAHAAKGRQDTPSHQQRQDAALAEPAELMQATSEQAKPLLQLASSAALQQADGTGPAGDQSGNPAPGEASVKGCKAMEHGSCPEGIGRLGFSCHGRTQTGSDAGQMIDGSLQSGKHSKLSQSDEGHDSIAKLHEWKMHAVEYPTVEEWFHSLVRAHFKGSLKVSACSL